MILSGLARSNAGTRLRTLAPSNVHILCLRLRLGRAAIIATLLHYYVTNFFVSLTNRRGGLKGLAAGNGGERRFHRDEVIFWNTIRTPRENRLP